MNRLHKWTGGNTESTICINKGNNKIISFDNFIDE